MKKETESGESLGVQSRPELHSISHQDHIARGLTIREVGRERGRWRKGRERKRALSHVVSVEADAAENSFGMSLMIKPLGHGPSEQRVQGFSQS